MGLSEKIISRSHAILFEVLANTHVLYVKTRNFHWNVEGGTFAMLHALFEEQYTALAESGDEVAERIRMLGKKVSGSMKAFLEVTSLREAEEQKRSDEMTAELASDHALLANGLRGFIEELTSLGDIGSADLLTELLRSHEKAVWFLRSHQNSR